MSFPERSGPCRLASDRLTTRTANLLVALRPARIGLAVILAAGTALIPEAALADCPVAGAESVRLLRENPDYSVVVTKAGDDLVVMERHSTVDAQETGATIRAYRGLFTVSEESGDAAVTVEWDDLKKLDSLFPLAKGKEIKTGAVYRKDSGVVARAEVSLLVNRTGSLQLGACKYPVFEVFEMEKFADGTAGRQLRYYSADLGFFLDFVSENPGTKAVTEVNFDRIETVSE